MHIAVVADSAIMSRGNIVRSEFASKIGKRAELNFTIAKYVGIRCSAFLVLVHKEFEYVVHILLGKIHRIIRNTDFVANILHVRPILLASTTTVWVGFFPVGHIKSDNVKTLLLQKSSGNCAIHAAGHTDDNSFFLFVHTDILAFRRRYVKRETYIR
ncbi:putative uncharacterized protein [Firmicutes bacterium CAG:475]|nr:putative uncharacterized protein [Firmicutes bacterium CAG:475]